MQISNKQPSLFYEIKTNKTFYRNQKSKVVFCFLALTSEELLVYTRVGRNQMVQQFFLKAQDSHTREKQEGEGRAERPSCGRKPTYTVAGNLSGIQALTVKSTEVAPHRYLLISVEVRRLKRCWAH